MLEQFKELITTLDMNPGAAEFSLDNLMAEFGAKFPDQYLDFMRSSNGAEGPIGEKSYVAIWPIEEIKVLNKEYAVDEFAPGLILFAGDGGDTAYAFDTRYETMPIVEISLSNMNLEHVKRCGSDFKGFLEYLTH
jgi:hypothetical protein